jgi:glycosyltransferase involved in cell wall biosynthesis
MTYPLVSVIIPFYNHNNYVKQTLDSVLADPYPQKEIIIINDGSSDPDDSNITSWIDKHHDEISITYKKRENRGITKTLNEMVAIAKGQYIAHIASDDFFINNTFSDRVHLLKRHPNKLMLLSDAITVDENGHQLYGSAMFEQRGGKKEFYFTDRGLKREIIKRWCVVGPTTFIDKRLFDTIGGYDETLFYEDWDLFLRAVSKDLILFDDHPVAAHRWHKNNASSNPRTEYYRACDLAATAQKNLKNFSLPYKFMLWKRSRKWKQVMKKLEKGLNV